MKWCGGIDAIGLILELSRTFVSALKCRFACGSMLLSISPVVRFSLYERKTNNKKKIKYRCE
jgi:hypothetical protein